MASASMAGCVTAAVAVTPNLDVHRFKAKAKPHKSMVVASATSTQRRQFLTLLAVSTVLRVGSAQAREKKIVSICGVRKPRPRENVAEETVAPLDLTQTSAAQKNVTGSSSESSSGSTVLAREKKNVPIFGIRKPRPQDLTQSSAAQKNVRGSSSESSSDIRNTAVQKAGATVPPDAAVQAAAVTVAELIGVVVASSVVNKIVAPEG